ncbi:MAG: hypothetical protein EBX52_11860, partial [Proteobacteria bacterium]|nr:hypothetical protein [Pseudomonadota bacterium]
MIHIRFSMEFDSGVWQGPLQKNRATIGEAALGPLGLLDHLETRLGLKSPESPQHQRIIDYLNALKSKSTEPVFYQASLATDPMAVAEHLLYLRDRLIEAGWNQKTVPGIQKTEDLSKVEASFSNRSGIADRIKDVLDSLRSKKSLADPGRITLHDHEKELPFLWREIVLKELPRLGFTIQHAATSSAALAAPDSDLGKFANLRASPAKPTGDGSLLALSGRDPWESARYLSAFLATLSPEELQNTVAIVPPAHRGILLSALQARGIAFGGEHSETAYSRPALQILILAVALLWEPKDPGVALSLMTLESSPMSKRFRYGMKKSLAGSLDIGGPEWKSALEEVTAGLIEKLEQESPGAEEREKELERVRSRKRRIEEWFHAPAFSVEAGIPLDELKGTCARVSKWLGLMAQVKKQGSLYEAQSASQLLSEYAHSIAEKTITRERLLHLLLDSIGNGVSANVHKAGAGGLRVVESPSAVLEPAERVIWWDFSSASVNSFRETFYSKAEVAALQQQGVQWPDPSDQAVFTANRWRNPVLKAKSSLILVSQWLDARGSESGFHPLLMECIEKNSRNEWFSKILANLLEKESPTVTALLQKAGAVTAKVTGDPSRQRFEWEIAANAAGPRELESASSLEKLLGCELAYVLTYGAKLKGEDREVLQFDGRVTGTIAHEVLAKVFKKGARLKSDEAVRQARELLDEVIRK